MRTIQTKDGQEITAKYCEVSLEETVYQSGHIYVAVVTSGGNESRYEITYSEFMRLAMEDETVPREQRD